MFQIIESSINTPTLIPSRSAMSLVLTVAGGSISLTTDSGDSAMDQFEI